MQCLVLAMRRFADGVMALRICQEPVEGTLEFDGEIEVRPILVWNPGWPHTCDFTALSSGLLAGIIGICQHSNLKCAFKTVKFMLGKFYL